MTSINRYAQKLARKLFALPSEQEAFLQALHPPSQGLFPSAIAWLCSEHEREQILRHHQVTPLPVLGFEPSWVSRLPVGLAPGAWPEHQQGSFYCLNTSSVFSIAVLEAVRLRQSYLPQDEIITEANTGQNHEQKLSSPFSLLDMCCAPGGKVIVAQKMLAPQSTWCNEKNKKRLRALISNLKRCQLQTIVKLLSLDPNVIAAQVPSSMDVVIVDAPCSGQALLAQPISQAKTQRIIKEAGGRFHPLTVNKNVGRQRRILRAAQTVVKEEGFLAYMTCTYSLEENESNLEWFIKHYPAFEAVSVETLSRYQSSHSPLPCYRMYPQHGEGPGAFTVLLQKKKNRRHGKANGEEEKKDDVDFHHLHRAEEPFVEGVESLASVSAERARRDAFLEKFSLPLHSF